MSKEKLVKIYYKLKSIDNLSNNLQKLDKKQITDELYKIHNNIQEPIEYINQKIKEISEAEKEYEKFKKSPAGKLQDLYCLYDNLNRFKMDKEARKIFKEIAKITGVDNSIVK